MDTATLAAATPVTRDRYVDLLRVTSLGAVVVGHWLMAALVAGPTGELRATNVLALVPTLQPATWLLQVMPVFFLVGGFSHATALDSLQRRGGRYPDFVRSRAGRLLRPTALFAGVWLAAALAVELAGSDRGLLRTAARTVAQPLWFVGVYLAVVALAPAMLRWHRRLGHRAVAAPALLGAAAVGVDLLRFAAGVPHVGHLNVAFVWLAVHQLGFCYADGILQRGGRRHAAVLAAAGLTATAALTALGPYPVSMVGVPGERLSNMAPPTVALLAQAVWLTGLVLLLRPALSRWLRRPRVWRAVIAANAIAMTAFLWHLTAMFAVLAAAVAAGHPGPAAGTASWWLARPLWIAAYALVTAGLVAGFKFADRPRPTRTVTGPRRRRVTAAAASGAALCATGVLGLSAVGFGGLLAGRTATLVVLPVTPLLSAAVLGAGALLLTSTRRARR